MTSPVISIAVEDYQGILIGRDPFLFESFQKKLMAADGLFGDLPPSIYTTGKSSSIQHVNNFYQISDCTTYRKNDEDVSVSIDFK